MERIPKAPASRALSPRGGFLLLFCSLILFSQAYRFPSPVQNAGTFAFAEGYRLIFPLGHLLFTPFCSLADYLTLVSQRQAEVLAVWILIGSVFVLGVRRAVYFLVGFLVFVAWGALIPRPMAKLVPEDPDVLLIDFHSHTSQSHDGRKRFDGNANRVWHAAQGYGAAFITDHNETATAEHAQAASREDWQRSGYRSLVGEEISLLKTHLVILGNRERIDNQPYDSDPAKVAPFIAKMSSLGIPVIASLPEYWLNHWNGDLDLYVKSGLLGFEIVNSAPKALDFPREKRLQVIDRCKTQNLLITGISDNHGYGYATAVWNSMRIPGWQTLDPDALSQAVIDGLKRDRFEAVTVLARNRFQEAGILGLLLSPVGHAWTYWRSLDPLQAFIWCLWLLGVWGLTRFCIVPTSASHQSHERSRPKAVL